MESKTLERIRFRLLEKRRNVAEWLQEAPAAEKAAALGPAPELAVEAHLQVLDRAVEKAADESLGICRICHEHVETERLEMDYTADVCFAHFTPQELRQLESELELSQVVQRALLPQETPDIPWLDVAVFSRPAQILGGDYFDFYRFHDGAHGLAIADVAGHGVSSGLLMATVQTALRALVPENDSPPEILQHVNRLFLHNVNFTSFVTLFLGRFDLQTRALTYANAGHNPPLLVRDGRGSTVSWLKPTGAAIGLVEDFEVTAQEVALTPGDLLVFYTDGVTEAANGDDEPFGEERLAAVVLEQADSPARAVVHALRDALHEFTGGEPLADDATMLACKLAA
jgi:sigma-B regulation protein RsbU (phosphoserine phosphatase)